MRKLLFLDIDGVLNTQQYAVHRLEANLPIYDNYGALFDPEAVKQLERIVEATNCLIVISSAWRYKGLDTLQQLWQDRKLPGEVIDITPPSRNNVRGWEINQWLKQEQFLHIQYDPKLFEESKERGQVFSYCIIDDDTDMLLFQKPFFVLTSWRAGLTADLADKAIEILNTEMTFKGQLVK